MKWLLTFLIFQFIFLYGCEKRETFSPGNGSNNTGNRLLKVDVYESNGSSLFPRENILVELYNNRSDFIYRDGRSNFGYTDSTGRKTFEGVASGFYYVVASDSGRDKADSVSVPASAVVSFLEIVYY
ncbi:MAG: hypothetical protein HKN92_05250 [Chitinophagales bacterium]|nr:hypothetical protein [Chitinophagales bacterium]